MTLAGEEVANRGFKIRLYPTEEQKKMLLHNMQVSRAAYNIARAINLKEYEAWDKAREKFLKTLPEDITEEKKKKLLAEEKKKYVLSSPRQLSVIMTAHRKENPEKYAWMGNFDSLAYFNTVLINYEAAMKKFLTGYNKSRERISKK